VHHAFAIALGLLLAPASVAAPVSDGGPATQPHIEPVQLAEAAAVAPVDFETYADDPIGVKQIVLANGLTVMLSENHERPEVFGAVVVRTGGKNDPADNTGMAHYLEHMLFKGTKTLGTSDWEAEAPLQEELIRLYEAHKVAGTEAERKALQRKIAATVEKTYAYAIPNELDRVLSEMGGTGVNAFTSEDETVYHNTFPASQIGKWLEVYGHRFEDPVFRLFPTELEAVYEEKNITLDRFEVKLFESFTAQAFPEHPYGTQTVIGEVEHLKRPSLVAMREYFDKYYVANNMALVLSGDFDADAIMPQIEARFGTWRSGPDPVPRTGKVEPFDGRELVKLRVTPLRVGAFGFRTPTPRHPDYPAVMVMRELLYNEQGSGLIDRLVDEGKLLITFPFPLDNAEHGLEIIFFAPRILSQSFRNAENLIRDQFARVAQGEFDDATMLAIRDSLRRGEDRQWEDNEARALAMSSSFIRQDDWKGYLGFRSALAKVTREDVMRVAQTYFSDDFLAMRSRMGFPKKQRLRAPNYPSVKPKPGAESVTYEQLNQRPSPNPKFDFIDFEKDIRTTEVAKGVRLRSNPNPFNDTYSMELRFGVGRDAIRELWVAPEYLSRIGTRQHDPAAFKQALFAIGTTLDIEATVDELVVSVEGPEEHLSKALSLANELLSEPVADKKRWKSLRRERRGSAKVTRRDPDQRATALRNFAMLGAKSPQLRDYGKRGLRGLSPQKVLSAWKQAQGYEVEVRYAGSQEPRAVAEALRAKLRFGESLHAAVPSVVHPRVVPTQDTVYFLPKRNAVQSRLFFAVEGDPVSRKDTAAADAYSGYLGGSMAGLIFQEIREFRALAYSAWGRFFRDPTPEQQGYFLGGIGCQADKTDEAIEVMMGLIKDMPRKTEQMGALRSALIRSQETSTPGFRELQSVVEFWTRLGYRADPRKFLLPAYEELTFEDIDTFYSQQVRGRPVTLMVVGDPRSFDADGLSEYGRVIKVKERQLYAP
jgi:predicted Zn-dependent peptidase